MKYFRIVISIVVLLGFAIWGISAFLSIDDLENCDKEPGDAVAGCQPSDAVVALSGGDTAARTAEAIRLYQDGWASVIIFSGAAADKSGPSNAEVMARQATQAGVPSGDIIIEDHSETTRENALETSNIFARHKISSAILVTSAYHQRRAAMEFAQRAPDIELRSHPAGNDKHWNPTWWWLTPTGWWLAMQEIFGSLIVAVRGVFIQ